MAPAQLGMDAVQDCNPQHSTSVAFDGEDTCIIESNLKDLSSSRFNDCKEINNGTAALFDGQSMEPNDPMDVEVDILTCTNANETRPAEAEDPDATEYSSSFANTISDTEKFSGLSEAEVESQSFGDSNLVCPYDAFSDLFQTRKKKLTNHWRSFIRPLMWRCKWTELRIKEIESQALRYTRELEACEQIKHSGNFQSTSEGIFAKSLPFSNQCYRRKAVKRRKRKRIENATDPTSYMSEHNLFSYLENKRCNLDGISMIDDFANKANVDQRAVCNDKFSMDNDQLFLKFRDRDSSLEKILWKIEIIHCRVHKLKNQLDVLMSKHAAKFSSSENLSLLAPCDGQTSSAPSPTFSAGNEETISVGGVYPGTQHSSGFDIEDLVMPESAMSSFGEAIHVPDIIESTVGLLSAADVTFHQAQTEHFCEDIVDNLLIYNKAAEINDLMGATNEPTEKHHEAEKGEEGESTNPCPTPTSDPDQMKKAAGQPEQYTLNSCLASDFQFPRNKRKRGDRKAGSGGWSMKSSGEHDSQ